MLTSQDDRGNVIINNNNDDVSDVDVNDETTATHAYSDRAPTNRYTTNDVHSDMETEKNEKNNTASTETRASSASPADPMGQDGNDETLAATKIQAGFRGYQVRKQMKTNKNGSDDAKQAKRSSGRRRNSGRRNEASKSSSDLEEKSATKIQAGIRGFLVRKRQRNAKDIKA